MGISAGLCEPPGTPPAYPRQNRSNSVATPHVTRPLARRSTASPVLSPIGSEPLMNPLDLKGTRFAHRVFPKVVLRLDPFLGEWLSPDYFETMSPPPAASGMLDPAKAELLRREDYTKYPDPGLQITPVIPNGANQLWKADNDTPLESVSSLANALPSPAETPPGGYIAPTPHYAISNNMPIPEGYVAHARDACLTVDCQWDSSRPPQGWGDGGTYGEEWTAMHRRFRGGVQKLMEWYAGCEKPTDLDWAAGDRPNRKANGGGVEEEEEEEEESVVVLVSHGAGCNALIGAITHQPALMDVGVASITLAVRKPKGEYEEVGPGGEFPPVHQVYDLKMTANTDHLRGVTSGSSSAAAAGASRGAVVRGRGNTVSSIGQGVLAPFTYTDSYGYGSPSVGSSVGIGRKGSKGPSTLSSELGPESVSGSERVVPTPPVRQGSLGLWSPVKREADEDDLFPDFDRGVAVSSADGSRSNSAFDEGGGVRDSEAALALPDFGRSVEEEEEDDGGGLWMERRERRWNS